MLATKSEKVKLKTERQADMTMLIVVFAILPTRLMLKIDLKHAKY
jgi:hypothetical protein